jgi:hypothetical protein
MRFSGLVGSPRASTELSALTMRNSAHATDNHASALLRTLGPSSSMPQFAAPRPVYTRSSPASRQPSASVSSPKAPTGPSAPVPSTP